MATLRTSRHLSLNAPLTPPRGATLAVATMVKILEHNAKTPQQPLPIPVALVLNYAALDFNFTSWMSAEHLKVLRSEQSSGNLPGLHELVAQKDHLNGGHEEDGRHAHDGKKGDVRPFSFPSEGSRVSASVCCHDGLKL